MTISRRLALLVALAMLATLPDAAAHHNPNIRGMEDYLVALINEGRESPQHNDQGGHTYGLALHEGLRRKSREHSAYMITVGYLNHDNFAVRKATADPDPAEANGPPDDGFTPNHCENVASATQIPNGAIGDGAIVRAIYDAWRDSPGHKACMFDHSRAGYSVAGAGIVEYDRGDGTYEFWVTLMVVQDTTPPDNVPYPGPTPTPTPTVTPSPTPTVTPSPGPTPTPSSSPGPTPTPSAQPSGDPTPRPSPTPTPFGLCVIYVGGEPLCVYLPVDGSP